MGKFRNKVVATDYVEKNYVKKGILEDFIKIELEMIRKNRGEIDDRVLDGMEAECNALDIIIHS